MIFNYSKLPTNTFGLKFQPSISSELDNADWIEHGLVDGNLVSMGWKHSAIEVEFSEDNKAVLLHAIDELKKENKFNSIFEIGVNRSGDVSSTRTIIDNMTQNTKYFGVDLNEGCLQPVRNDASGIHCLCANSSDFEQIMNWVREKGTQTFDLIHIDGWHSINQVMKDFDFVQFLNVGGYLLMHDVANHPGPHCVFDAIDEDMFEKTKLFDEPTEPDWGIAICKRIK
jgi:hypothetical protein